MTQLLSLAKELLKWIQNQRLKWKENQTIITTDFTQICSPSQVWSFKKILILFLLLQTFQPLSHANLEVLKTSPEKPGNWDLKPGDFQNMCQIIKKALFV